MGTYEFKLAKKACKLIPDPNEREAYEALFKYALIGLLTPGAKSKAIATLSIILYDYGMYLFNVWWEVRTHLNKAEEHYNNAQMHMEKSAMYLDKEKFREGRYNWRMPGGAGFG